MDSLTQNFIAYLHTERLVSSDQIERCLESWELERARGHDSSLPRIFVQKGYLSKAEVKRLLAEIKELEASSKAQPKASGGPTSERKPRSDKRERSASERKSRSDKRERTPSERKSRSDKRERTPSERKRRSEKARADKPRPVDIDLDAAPPKDGIDPVMGGLFAVAGIIFFVIVLRALAPAGDEPGLGIPGANTGGPLTMGGEPTDLDPNKLFLKATDRFLQSIKNRRFREARAEIAVALERGELTDDQRVTLTRMLEGVESAEQEYKRFLDVKKAVKDALKKGDKEKARKILEVYRKLYPKTSLSALDEMVDKESGAELKSQREKTKEERELEELAALLEEGERNRGPDRKGKDDKAVRVGPNGEVIVETDRSGGRLPGRRDDENQRGPGGRGAKVYGGRRKLWTSGTRTLKGPPADVQASKIPLATPKPIEAARKERFNSDIWAKRVERMREWVKNEKARRLKDVAKEAERARKRSKRSPIVCRVTEGFEIRNGVIKDFDDTGFTIKTRKGDIGYRWDLADRRLAFEVRKLAVNEDDAESWMRYARFCLKNRFFKEARKAYGKAVRIKPLLRTRVPDLTRIQKAADAYHGDFRRLGGGMVRFDYEFNSAVELTDFRIGAKASGVKGGRMLVQPPPGPNSLAQLSLKEVYFENFMRATLDIPDQPNAVVFAGIVAPQIGAFSVYYYRDLGRIQCFEQPDLNKPLRPLGKAVKTERGASRLRVRLNGRTLTAYVGTRVVARFNLPDQLESVEYFFGGSNDLGTLAIDRLMIDGQVTRRWMEKTFQEADDAVAAALAESGVGAPASSWNRRPDALSADDTLAKSSQRVRELVRDARKLMQSLDTVSYTKALSMVTEAIDRDPSNAVPFYLRARIALVFRLDVQALVDLNHAVTRAGGFYEAIGLRAVVLTRLERLKDAEEDIKRAEALRADGAYTLYARASWMFEEERTKEAVEELEVAYALWPKPLPSMHRPTLIATALKNYTHVLNGPPWERVHKVETAHYIVLTDISKERAKFFADHLEWIHSYYRRTFTVRSGRKARALFFSTREGYNQYAELTANARVEWTAGVYYPDYDQLLVFEGKDLQYEDDEYILQVVYHEGFHQFISRVVKDLPAWANEGMAEFYGIINFDEFGSPSNEGGIQHGRLYGLQQYLAQGGRPLAFADLMTQSLPEFQQGNVILKYAQSWAMVHFFMTAPNGRRDLFLRYFRLLREGRSRWYAFHATYGQANLGELERAWLEHVGRLKAKRPKGM